MLSNKKKIGFKQMDEYGWLIYVILWNPNNFLIFFYQFKLCVFYSFD